MGGTAALPAPAASDAAPTSDAPPPPSPSGSTPPAAPQPPARASRHRVALDGTQLVVRTTARQHAELQRVLPIWERHGCRQVTIECRLIATREDLAAPLGIGWSSLAGIADALDIAGDGNGDAGDAEVAETVQGTSVQGTSVIEEPLPIAVAKLTDERVRALVQRVQSNVDGNILFAPKLTLFNGTRGQIFSGMQRPFVVGLRPVAGQSFEPHVSVVTEGTEIVLRPVLAGDGAAIDLSCALELRAIDDVRTVTALVGGASGTIQIPRVQLVRLRAQETLEPGESLLLGCLPAFERPQFHYLLITPRVLPEAGETGRLGVVSKPVP